jgi:hypothetical protein
MGSPAIENLLDTNASRRAGVQAATRSDGFAGSYAGSSPPKRRLWARLIAREDAAA